MPDMKYKIQGPLLEDGRVPVDGIVSYECSFDRVLKTKCYAPDAYSDGAWYPPFLCPNMTGKK